MANRYWVGGTSAWDLTVGTKWAATSGGAGGQTVPTGADDVFFDAASGTVTVTSSVIAKTVSSLNFTGFTGTFTGTLNTLVQGSLTLSLGMTYSNTGNVTFNAATTGTANITCAGKSLASTTCNNAAGIFNFLDAFSCSVMTLTAGTYNVYGSFTCTGYVLTLTTGTLNCNSNTFNIYGFNSSSGTNVRTLNIGTGNAFWTITGSFGWVASINGPMTIIGGTGFNNTIYFTDTTNTALLIGSNTQYPFDNIYFNRGASTGAINFFLNVSAGSTYTNFIDNGTAAHTISFSPSRTYTFGHFYARGSAGNIITITSSGASLVFNKSPSGLVNLDYVTVSAINSSPTNTWYAGPNSTIVSGANWILTAPPTRKLGGAGVG